MTEIIIYTKDYCPHCVKVKELFKIKGYTEFKEIDITHSSELQQEMLSKANGKKTVPQVFVNGVHVGGCDDTYALDKAGKLDGLLKANG